MNQIFVVKDIKPARVIAWVSVASGLAADIGLVVYRRLDEDAFLNHCGWLGDKFVRFVACLGVALFLFLFMSGIYNLWKRQAGRSLPRKDNT